MRENRKHPRITSRLRCWCEGDNITVLARIGDLSEGGLFLRTSTPLEAGSRTLLCFGTGERGEIRARAVVVWARGEGERWPPGMGLRFEGLDTATREEIRRLIASEGEGQQTVGT